MSKGIELIAAERERQITEEGYDAEHDAGHARELVLGAHAYVAASYDSVVEPGLPNVLAPEYTLWPWESKYWKPTGDPMRDLTKAGALIAAAIDSLTTEEVPADAQ